ncbi:hypothetical protein GY45DRAFT_201835 [Cubamyces sp. BRFM 1775]|nr:hypothetical protein GY45DRAFT_201835 [Cubamyces sp. BRFM 1775]
MRRPLVIRSSVLASGGCRGENLSFSCASAGYSISTRGSGHVLPNQDTVPRSSAWDPSKALHRDCDATVLAP